MNAQARTVTAFHSPENDRNYFQAMVDQMIIFLTKIAVGQIVTYEELISHIDAKSKDYAVNVYRVAARRVEVMHGIFFRNRLGEGYERVSSGEALEVCKNQIKHGLRRVKRGAERTHSIDMQALTDNQRAEILGIQSTLGRLQLMYEAKG